MSAFRYRYRNAAPRGGFSFVWTAVQAQHGTHTAHGSMLRGLSLD